MDRREFVCGALAAAGAAAARLPAAAAGKETDRAKLAVVYYSWSGNTRFAAETIAKRAGGDLFEIKAEKPYNSDYGACCDEARPECRNKTLRPVLPIAGLDLARYDVVFAGTPNWWGTMAPPVRTFLTRHLAALAGKRVCVFQTHGGGGMQNVGGDFAALVGGRARVLSPKAFAGSSIRSSVSAIEAFVDGRLGADPARKPAANA